jgi:hypothetical protein
MSAQNEIDRLMHEADNTKNLDKLWEIVEKLNYLSAWDAAGVVIHQIRRIEQKAAAQVMA